MRVWYLVASGWEVLDGGEGLDLDILQLVDGRVHLGDHDCVVILERLGKFVPDWRQLFAVAAPWSV